VSVPRCTSADGQALNAGFWTFLQTPPAPNAARPLLKTSQIGAESNRPTTTSLSNQTQHLYQLYSDRPPSDSSSVTSITRVAPDDIIHGSSVPISPPSPNNRQITPFRRRREISRKPDLEDTIKASDSETIINLPQYNFIPRILSTTCSEVPRKASAHNVPRLTKFAFHRCRCSRPSALLFFCQNYFTENGADKNNSEIRQIADKDELQIKKNRR
jgi:hypothetical protein